MRKFPLYRCLRYLSACTLIVTVVLSINSCRMSTHLPNLHSKFCDNFILRRWSGVHRVLGRNTIYVEETKLPPETSDHQLMERFKTKKKRGDLAQDGNSEKDIFSPEIPKIHLKEIRNIVNLSTPSTKIKKQLSLRLERVYKRRRTRLIQSCGGQVGSKWETSMQLIAVPDRKFTVCVVQKAGSSSWHHLVYDLRVPEGKWSGMGHTQNRLHGKTLPIEIKTWLISSKNATRVITVRHPFARLISGWNNKFHKNHLQHSSAILKYFPGIGDYVGRHEIDDDHVIAFEDFAQYLVDVGLDKVDLHFHTIESLCRPCDFPYDFIVKAETSRDNAWWVLERVNATMPFFVKHTATGSGAENLLVKQEDLWKNEREVMAAFFRKIPRDTVESLKEMYKVDFERFAYTFDTETRMAGEIAD